MVRPRNHLAEVLRRRRSVEICQRELAAAVGEYHRAIARLYEDSGLSYGQLAPLLGVTRSRVQQLVEAGRQMEERQAS